MLTELTACSDLPKRQPCGLALIDEVCDLGLTLAVVHGCEALCKSI
jgi:hypothetical protein